MSCVWLGPATAPTQQEALAGVNNMPQLPCCPDGIWTVEQRFVIWGVLIFTL